MLETFEEVGSMMGRQSEPEQLIFDFRLDDHVSANQLLRRIDVFVDLESVRQDLKPFYSQIDRPSVDPELMIRMLIVDYSYGIRSERRLCEDVHLNLAFRWICQLANEPRQKTGTKSATSSQVRRHSFNSKPF